ncbi:hypothetical protein HED60_00215 [Planctomycetales bacterium ZRK34]|nr:hypothetical protein HED60_00215 [Planctomycetales bacterium ZRK34]
MQYESKLPYHTKRMHAAAIYCSDGRVCEQYDDFLQHGLKLPRYDRVALPGGPACLAGYSQARLEEAGVIDELKFLVDAHGLQRIVLIQHEDCAFYTSRLAAGTTSLEQLQKADLVRAAYAIRHAMKMDTIDAFFARRTEQGVLFEPVELE